MLILKTKILKSKLDNYGLMPKQYVEMMINTEKIKHIKRELAYVHLKQIYLKKEHSIC
mgnify:CR=1 FL=1